MAAVTNPFCRGFSCDGNAECLAKQQCQYRSSADEAREVLSPPQTIAVTQIVRHSVTTGLKQTMPEDSAERKRIPLCSGVLDYFPAALAAVARLSKLGNDKHNPGQPLHWARGKSTDHADCIARHLVDRGVIDPDTGESHTVEVAWRALALLQEEEESRGAPLARGAKLPEGGR